MRTRRCDASQTSEDELFVNATCGRQTHGARSRRCELVSSASEATWTRRPSAVPLWRSSRRSLLLCFAMALFVLEAATGSAAAHQGHFHSLTFGKATEFSVVSPGPRDAFAWPYLFILPPAAVERAERGDTVRLLVVPNDTGHASDRFLDHEVAALETASQSVFLAEAIESVLLVPMVARPAAHERVQTQALDRDCFRTEVDVLRRPDLQVLAMIDHASKELRRRGWSVDDRALMSGFSAGGLFVQRFTALHPERVAAAASGGPGGWVWLPMETVGEYELPYPVGAADLEELTDAPFDRDAWSRVPQLIYMESGDSTDLIRTDDNYDSAAQELILSQFGADLLVRWETAQQTYRTASPRSRLEQFEGDGHEITPEMQREIVAFFKRNLSGLASE